MVMVTLDSWRYFFCFKHKHLLCINPKSVAIPFHHLTTRRTFNLLFLFNLSTTYQFCKYIIYKILHSWWKNSLTTVILYNGSQSRISNCNHRIIIFKFVAINFLYQYWLYLKNIWLAIFIFKIQGVPHLHENHYYGFH